ncbi:acyltransferase [Shewanella sp. FJAT-51649]|uniref:acyltransferase n=1 Tax=Shewanella sp. FJAT-51649 TaxID=2864210 RepID=UPI001C6555C1|nr:acyltransferase [Shewanella sp. FJAT-51649]QYJ72798.1 acyltransferase [Shewanella sp. FJAT-51649]
MKRLLEIYKNNGFFLSFFKIYYRFSLQILDLITTYMYSRICKQFGAGVIIQYGVKIEQPRNVSIGNNVFIGRGTIIQSETSTGELVLEDSVHIGNDCHIDHSGNVTIGEKALLSESVFIYSHSHGYLPRSKPLPIDKYISKSVWIGARATILESATIISEKNIIAAHSVVVKSILDKNVICAGVPAKEVKKYAD